MPVFVLIVFWLVSHPAIRPTDVRPCPAEVAMQKAGLVLATQFDPSIRVELKYSTQDNFMGFDVYGCMHNAYLQKPVARQLAKASALLQKERPDLRLLIYDAARPRWAQQILWDSLKKPESQKHVYVAHPKKGSMHNYGCAVDLTVCDAAGKPLDMGTHYDFFGLLAQPRKETAFLQAGKLRQIQVDNRKLLRRIMTSVGFSPITSEWWHFNYGSLREAKATYKMIN